MKQIVMLLIAILVLSLISGCSHKLIYVPTECEIPSTQEPKLKIIVTDNVFDESKRCGHNYTTTKEAYDILKKAIEVCK